MGAHILIGNCMDLLPKLPEKSVHTVVTSPPYWGLRDYGIEGQFGLEATPELYVQHLVEIFDMVKRVLRDDGTLWLNLGDTYASNWPCNRRNVVGQGSLKDGKRANRPPRMGKGLKDKDLVGIPWMVAFALRDAGWYLRLDIIWHKTNPMPEAVRDRPTKAHEYIFLMSKSRKYYYDHEAVKEKAVCGRRRGTKDYQQVPGGGDNSSLSRSLYTTRNKRSVWTISTKSFKGAHFATFPPDLIEPCIKAGSPEGGTVLDPFAGAGTTGLVADRLGRHSFLIELSPDYAEMARNRIETDT